MDSPTFTSYARDQPQLIKTCKRTEDMSNFSLSAISRKSLNVNGRCGFRIGLNETTEISRGKALLVEFLRNRLNSIQHRLNIVSRINSGRSHLDSTLLKRIGRLSEIMVQRLIWEEIRLIRLRHRRHIILNMTHVGLLVNWLHLVHSIILKVEWRIELTIIIRVPLIQSSFFFWCRRILNIDPHKIRLDF